MRVAVAIFGDDVSPRFGCSGQFLVASIEGGQIQDKQTVEAKDMTCSQLPDFLASLGVSEMICGGIERPVHQEIESRGIEVIWGVIGPAAEALSALGKGTLRQNQFVPRDREPRRRTISTEGLARQEHPE